VLKHGKFLLDIGEKTIIVVYEYIMFPPKKFYMDGNIGGCSYLFWIFGDIAGIVINMEDQ